MRTARIAAVAIVIVAVLIGAIFYSVVLTQGTAAVGFDPKSIRSPDAISIQPVNASLPTPVTSTTPSYDNLNLYWVITEDIFAGYGGALELTIENKNSGRLYIYAYGLQWTSTGDSYWRNCSVTVDRDAKVELGLLIFNAPSCGEQEYKILLKLAASNAGGWRDYGEVPSQGSLIDVRPLGDERSVEDHTNTLVYYNQINERVSYADAQAVVDLIKSKYPGNYSIPQIAEAYTWVRENIAYLTDGSGDYWQNVKETLERHTGDCEDHAILMASVIGALGGNARVNLIEQHAFPTVFIASDQNGLMEAKRSLASYYGVDNATYQMSYLVDELGYWLVIDTTGFPYAGGLPSNSESVDVNGDWTVLSTYIHCIDATGSVARNTLLGIF